MSELTNEQMREKIAKVRAEVVEETIANETRPDWSTGLWIERVDIGCILDLAEQALEGLTDQEARALLTTIDFTKAFMANVKDFDPAALDSARAKLRRIAGEGS